MTLRYDGSDVKLDVFYAITGETLKSLLQIAIRLNDGNKLSPDERRDLAQAMQAKLVNAVAFDLNP